MKFTKNLIAEIEGLHDIVTGNNILYTDEALSEIDSWIAPYPKPVILHHNDENGKIVGRILEVKKIASQFKEGMNALWFKVRVTDEETKKGIRDGTLLTTSVGARGLDVECSICGHKISSGKACPHKKGRTYNNQKCHWIVRKMKGVEISLVIVPSDKYSMIIKFYDEDELKKDEDDNKKEGAEKMTLEEEIKQLKEDLQKAETDLKESKRKQEEIEASLADEVQLREGLEEELSKVKAKDKEDTINKIIQIRESLGMRKIEKEDLEKRPDVYLQEALEDLQDEMNFKESQKDIEDLNKEKIKNEQIKLTEKQGYEEDDYSAGSLFD